MRAAILVEADTPLVVEEVTPLPMEPNEVTVRVAASGVCHSDWSGMKGLIPTMRPQILGHEGAGVVEEVGAAVTRVKVGDRVITTFQGACGECWYCVRGHTVLCERGQEVRRARIARGNGELCRQTGGLGTFSDAILVHERSLVPVQTDLPDEQLALIGCGVTTGVGAVLNSAKVEPGSSVVIIGCGGVGQSGIQGARIAGASRIIAVDPVALKRNAAEKLGATDSIDPNTTDVVTAVKELTDGRGADYAFDMIGLASAARQGFACIRPGGTHVQVGVLPIADDVAVNGMELTAQEKRVIGSNAGSIDAVTQYTQLIGFVEDGSLDLTTMVSKRYRLDEVNDAFAAMERGEVLRGVLVN